MKLTKMTLRSLICLTTSLLIMGSFFLVQTLVVFDFIDNTYDVALFSYYCAITFSFPFFIFIKDFLSSVNSNEKQLIEELTKKNTYLEHATKILRHDMHSGINTYMPRGISSLKRRLSEEQIRQFKLESPLKLLTEGLEHTQQVYRGVYEFTNLVKDDEVLSRSNVDLTLALNTYLRRTAYFDQVVIEDLGEELVNEPLFNTAIDNLIRNGLKYNDSKTKIVKIFKLDNNTIGIKDNGRGLSSVEFEEYSKPYTRKRGQKECGSGLGLNICVAIIKEHGFKISAQELPDGTLIRIKIR